MTFQDRDSQGSDAILSTASRFKQGFFYQEIRNRSSLDHNGSTVYRSWRSEYQFHSHKNSRKSNGHFSLSLFLTRSFRCRLTVTVIQLSLSAFPGSAWRRQGEDKQKTSKTLKGRRGRSTLGSSYVWLKRTESGFPVARNFLPDRRSMFVYVALVSGNVTFETTGQVSRRLPVAFFPTLHTWDWSLRRDLENSRV